jgi:hypothetical protein
LGRVFLPVLYGSVRSASLTRGEDATCRVTPQSSEQLGNDFMRLTLRTMLAYLDDILEPDDTEDIGKKIDESEFATNLVHRTRDCMRRLRLGVPSLVGRGLASDPNSVAEYLDNTLDSERVGEFEKVCLESDVHLAEVASCHQILTLVLGESAEIDPDARHRMYHLASQIDAPPVQSDALRPTGAAAPATLMTATAMRRAKPEVPDYLREPRSRFWPLAAMVLVAATLTFGGLMVLGPAALRERAVAFLQGGAVEAPQAAVDQPVAPVDESLAPPSDPAAQTPSSPVDAAPGDALLPATGEPATPADPVAPAADRTPDPIDAPSGDPPVVEPSVVEPALGGNEPEAAAKTANTPGPLPPVEAVSAPATPPTVTPPADDAAEVPAADLAVSPAVDADSAPAKAPAESVVETFGRYTSKRDLLLKFDVETGNWNRLPSMATLSKGDRLLSLPLFRPVITTSSSITIQAEGPSQLELAGFTEEGTPILTVEYGRLLMATVGKPGNSLLLQIGDNQVQLTFVDADANLALDVHRVLPPGKDPEAGPAPLAVDLYATSGTVRVRDGDKQLDMQAPAHRALVSAGTAPVSENEFPRWVNSEALTDAERQATNAIEPLVTPGESAIVTLKELTDISSPNSITRRREVRALATRSLSYLGDFDPSIKALNDTKEKLSWGVCMEELRLAVARSPETAAEVRATFVKQRGAEAATFLFRTLWGYSAGDLKSGAAKDLVDAMDNDAVDYRVMSFLTLQNITGAPHHGYRPEDQANKRRTPYNAWKEKLRQGKIVPQAAGPTKGKASKGA